MRAHPTPPPRNRASEALPWVALCLITVLGAFALQQEMASPLGAPDSTRTSAVVSSVPLSASPIVVQFPDTLILVTHTALPEPSPSPTYEMLPTPLSITCGVWLERGTICEMPVAPNTPTPTIPDCPTAPASECVWKGTLMGTPVARSNHAE